MKDHRHVRYRKRERLFTQHMNHALMIANTRPMPVRCSRCNVEMIKVKQYNRTVYLCTNCGNSQEVKENG